MALTVLLSHDSAFLSTVCFPPRQGEQWEFAAYGLLYAAASGREVLAHEMVEMARRLGGGPGSGSSSSAAAGARGPGASPAATALARSGGDSRSAGKGSTSAGQGGAGAAPPPPDLEGDRFVGPALAACRAYLGGNVVRFLRLYEGAPRMAPYLLDLLLAKLRGRAYSEPQGRGCGLGVSVRVCVGGGLGGWGRGRAEGLGIE